MIGQILDVRWPILFFSETFYLQLSQHRQNWTKNQCGKVKQNSRFLSARHRILPSCGCKAREIVVGKCELVLWGTSPVDLTRLIGPFKPYLAENISLQSSNCNILGLAATVALFANEARFTLPGVFSPKRSRRLPSSLLSQLTHPSLIVAKVSEKYQCWNIFAPASLIKRAVKS